MKKYDCPQCGRETETLSEGYCVDCRDENQLKLDQHNHDYDHWQSLSDDERNNAINATYKMAH